jgi:hypothetical protein
MSETHYDEIAAKLKGEGYCADVYEGQICTSKPHNAHFAPVHVSTDSKGNTIKRWMRLATGEVMDLYVGP